MFMGGDFADSNMQGGLEFLAQAIMHDVDTSEPENSPSTTSQAAVQQTVQTNAHQEGGPEVPNPVAVQLTDGPEVASLDKDRLAEARRISDKNKPNNIKLTGWQPAQTKPRKQELWQAVLERDPSQRPKNWMIQDMVKYLLKHPLPDSSIIPDSGVAPPPKPTASPVVPTGAPAVDSEDKQASSKQRWHRHKFVRNPLAQLFLTATADSSLGHFRNFCALNMVTL